MSDNQDDGGQKKQPSYHAFQVDNGQDGSSYFNKIGVGFEHKDGQGHTVNLSSIPVDGKIVLRTPQERLQDLRNQHDPQPEQQVQQMQEQPASEPQQQVPQQEPVQQPEPIPEAEPVQPAPVQQDQEMER